LVEWSGERETMAWNRGIKRLLLVILAILPPAVVMLGVSILYSYSWDWEFVLDLLFIWLFVLLFIWGGCSLTRWWIARVRDGYLY
jgi:hypothetical protein